LQTVPNKLDWFALSWTSRWFPVSRAIPNVFLITYLAQPTVGMLDSFNVLS